MIGRLASDDASLSTLFTAGAVEALVALLQSSQEVQQTALEILGNLTRVVSASHAALVAAGAVPRLVHMLHYSDCARSVNATRQRLWEISQRPQDTRSASLQPEPSPPSSS